MIESAEWSDEPRPDLSNIEVVFVNSRAALDYAYGIGLPKTTEIRSASPAIILDPDLSIKSVEARYTPADIASIHNDLIAMVHATLDTLRNDGDLCNLSLTVARSLFRAQTFIFKCMGLEEADFHRPVAVIEVAEARAMKDRFGNAPWGAILSDNRQFVPIRVQSSELQQRLEYWPPDPGFATRLRFADWQTIAYRAALHFWARLPSWLSRGTVLIFNEDDLLKETAFHLARSGFALKHLDITGPTSTETDPKDGLALEQKLAPQISEGLAAFLAPSAVAPAANLLLERIKVDAGRYRAALTEWRRSLPLVSQQRPTFVLANKISTPEGAALCDVCREQNLPTAVFQHGVTREISEATDRYEFMYETTNADVFFTFNEATAKVTNSSPLVRGKAVAVGMERSYRQAGKSVSTSSEFPPIWYVSTALCIGSIVPGLVKGETDDYMARFEIAVIDQVLSRLPHGVLYKPYPVARYPDPDPVIALAQQCSNITIYRERMDLRYVVAKSRVLVTSRSTSTLGWCLASKRPVVFLDTPQQPLNLKAREAIKKALFLFDGSSPNVLSEMQEFLAQPLTDIDAQWTDRSKERSETFAKYFNGGSWKAGLEAANYLTNMDFGQG